MNGITVAPPLIRKFRHEIRDLTKLSEYWFMIELNENSKNQMNKWTEELLFTVFKNTKYSIREFYPFNDNRIIDITYRDIYNKKKMMDKISRKIMHSRFSGLLRLSYNHLENGEDIIKSGEPGIYYIRVIPMKIIKNIFHQIAGIDVGYIQLDIEISIDRDVFEERNIRGIYF
jgi:hypothetical protein